MEIKTHIFVLFIAGWALAVEGMFDGEPREVKCKGEVIKGTVDFHKNMMVCIGEFKAAKTQNAENRKRGLKCLIVCALTKGGVFDEKGAYVEAKMNEKIDGSLSAPLATLQKQEAAMCAKNVAPPAIDPADKNCNNFKPFLKCLKKGWMKTCVEGYDPDIMEDEDR